MWLQFGLAVTGDKRFVACKFCHRVFEISTEPSGFRSHREFCSGSCKTLDYRKRARSALQLAAEGKTPDRIAAAIDTDVATVNRWIARNKRGLKLRREPRR
jgi:transposase-like protein